MLPAWVAAFQFRVVSLCHVTLQEKQMVPRFPSAEKCQGHAQYEVSKSFSGFLGPKAAQRGQMDENTPGLTFYIHLESSSVFSKVEKATEDPEVS